MLEMLGIRCGDLFAFARYLGEATSQQPSPITEKTLEAVYNSNMSFLLAPLFGTGGFAVEHETIVEGGCVDIRIASTSSNTSTEKPYAIFELKQLDCGTDQTLEKAMTSENLKRVSKEARAECHEAMGQINERCEKANKVCAEGATVLFYIAITFWQYWLCLIARRMRPRNTQNDRTTWDAEPFTDEDVRGKSTYKVRSSVKAGDLIATSMFLK
ncbi:hypothetical protein GGF42_007359 [Coemansia sp. RSA 2424]|nr:hypothetical protein GGF42_007359 [Coemansia sp. RSA 2424]